ncbi:hypothetical protein BpHYR1_038820 [Brachionus plicatilis]|uniref:Uncharacterized protein n=1 Tax=Brachionus plicatilis TaxID=10195 RepID=A0A3M7SA49_BRAPC|nr:hypothetical protein BpHYR1_038820 [Brachionus plicatilis]
MIEIEIENIIYKNQNMTEIDPKWMTYWTNYTRSVNLEFLTCCLQKNLIKNKQKMRFNIDGLPETLVHDLILGNVKQSSLSRFFKPKSPAKTSGPQTSNSQNISSISITKFVSTGLFDYIPKSFSLHIIEFLLVNQFLEAWILNCLLTLNLNQFANGPKKSKYKLSAIN